MRPLIEDTTPCSQERSCLSCKAAHTRIRTYEPTIYCAYGAAEIYIYVCKWPPLIPRTHIPRTHPTRPIKEVYVHSTHAPSHPYKKRKSLHCIRLNPPPRPRHRSHRRRCHHHQHHQHHQGATSLNQHHRPHLHPAVLDLSCGLR